MSERNSMNDMFGQLKNYQVEAPLEVMELAIAKANRKRRMRFVLRWTAALLLMIGVALGWNWNSREVKTVAPLINSTAPALIAPAEPKIQMESETVVEPAHAPTIQSKKSKVKSTTTNPYQIAPPIVEDSNHSTLNASSQVQEAEIVVDSSEVAPKIAPVKVDEEQSKKTKSKGQRKLKLIIPQP